MGCLIFDIKEKGVQLRLSQITLTVASKANRVLVKVTDGQGNEKTVTKIDLLDYTNKVIDAIVKDFDIKGNSKSLTSLSSESIQLLVSPEIGVIDVITKGFQSVLKVFDVFSEDIIRKAFIDKFNLSGYYLQEAEQKAILRASAPTYNSKLDKYLFGVQTLILQFKSRFAPKVTAMTYVDFVRKRRILNDGELNDSIANFKISLFNTLRDFIKTHYKTSVRLSEEARGSLFSDGSVNVKGLIDLRKSARYLFNNIIGINLDTLLSAYINLNDSTSINDNSNNYLTNKELVEAYEAYVLLQEDVFDEVLNEAVPNLSIQNTYGKLMPKTWTDTYGTHYKYSFILKNNYYATWGDEDVDATKLMGNVATLLFTTIPVRDPETGLLLPNQRFTKERVFTTLNILRNPGFINKLPEGSKLKKLLLDLHNNPVANYIEIFKELLSKEDSGIFKWIQYASLFGKDAKEHRTVIYSFYRHFLDTSNPSSLINIDKKVIFGNAAIKTYALTDAVIGALDRTTSTSYTSYGYDRDAAKVKAKEIVKKLSDSDAINLSTTIDLSNTMFSENERANVVRKYNIQIHGADVTFTLFGNDRNKDNLVEFRYIDKKLYTKNKKSGNFTKIFDFGGMTERKHLLLALQLKNTSQLTKEERILYELLRFSDDVLKTNYTKGSQYDFIEAYFNIAESDSIPGLLNMSINAARNHVAYLAYNNYVKRHKESSSKITNIVDFVESEDFKTNVSNYYSINSQNDEIVDLKNKRLRVYNTSVNLTVRNNMVLARLQVSGKYYKANLKNAQGNSIPVNRMGNLATSLQYLINTDIIQNPKSALHKNLFAGGLQNLQGCTVKTDLDTGADGFKKTVDDFTESELIHSAIFYDFYGTLKNAVSYNKDTGNASYSTELPTTKAEFLSMGSTELVGLFQMTTYSDKKTIYLFKCGTIYWIEPENEQGFAIDITRSSFEDLNKAIITTIGGQYKDIYRKVLNDYRYNVNDTYLEEVLKPKVEKTPMGSEIIEALPDNIVVLANKIQQLKETGKIGLMQYLSDDEVHLVMSRISIEEYKKLATHNPKQSIPKYIGTKDINGLTFALISPEFVNAFQNINLETRELNQEAYNLYAHLLSIYTPEVILQIYSNANILENDIDKQTLESIVIRNEKSLAKEIIGFKKATDLNPEQLMLLINITDWNTFTKVNEDTDHSAVIEDLHYIKGLSQIAINRLLKNYATKLYNPEVKYAGTTLYNARMLLDKGKFLANLIKYNIIFDTTKGTYLNPEVFDALLVAGYNTILKRKDFYDVWKDPSTQQLYLARFKNPDGTLGEPITFENFPNLNFETDEAVLFMKNVELNPLLERYFLSEILITENLRLSSTGAAFVHKNSAKPLEDILLDIIRELASREGSQYKRLVINSATMQFFLLKSITGVPPVHKVAVIKDLKAYMWNINGEKASEDAHDGSGYDHPVWAELQNMALQDCAVGEDKKLITHALDPYGQAKLEKYAVYSAYNERMRQSKYSPHSFYYLVKNLSTREKFGDNISFSTNLFGKELHLSDVAPSELFFRKGNKHYKIMDLLDNDIANHLYNISYIEVDETGNTKPDTELLTVNITISNMWELMEALGGCYSESKKGGKLVYGNANILTIANYCNNVGTYTGTYFEGANGEKLIAEYPTLNNCILPLKSAFIHTATNASGFKNAPDKINGPEAWLDGTVLYTMEMPTTIMGPLMDADHIVVNGDHQSEMTEPTLIISALEAMGYTHSITREIYRDLGKVALAAIAPYHKATKEFIESDYNLKTKSNLYHKLGELIIKAVLKDNENFSTSSEVLKLINDNFRTHDNHDEDEFKIPFSNPNIFSKSLAEFTATLNKKAIKRKFSGEGAVMVPAYDIMTYVQVGNDKLTYDDLVRRAYLDSTIAEQYADDQDLAVLAYLTKLQDAYLQKDENGLIVGFQQELSIDKALPEDKIIVKYKDNDLIKYKYCDLSDYDLYIQIKHDSNVISFVPAIYINTSDPLSLEDKKIITTNLKPQITYWTITDPNTKQTVQYNLYDLPEVVEVINERRGVEELLNIGKKFIALESKKAYYKLHNLPLDVQFIEEQLQTLQARKSALLDKYKESPLYTGVDKKKYNLQLLDRITKALHLLSKGIMRINGIDFRIDAGSLKVNEAEMIMSKIYADRIGLTGSESLQEIKDKGPAYFEEKINTTTKTDMYDICYLTNTGHHLYITSSVKDGMTLNDRVMNDYYVNNFIIENGKEYRIDGNGDKLYQTGEYKTVKVNGKEVRKLIRNIWIYQDTQGNEILVVKNPNVAANLYNGHIYNGILFGNLLNLEYSDGLFERWEQRKVLSDFRNTVENKVETLKDSSTEFLLELKKALAQKQYSSFLSSLDFIVGRIPAQSLQSFMAMKCVAFLNTNKNVVHVSHYLTWLQGSDYDIDKAYIMGNDYDSNGLLSKWSPYFDYSSYESLKQSYLLPTPNGRTYEFTPYSEEQKDTPGNITAYMVPFLTDEGTLQDKINLLKHVDLLSTICYDASKFVGVTQEQIKEAEKRVIDIINNHNQFFVRNERLALGGFKNSVSSKIHRVISDVRNALNSYTPIGMGETREAADNSTAGRAIETMTAFDPTTKLLMTVLNMAGRKVIGIAATGEKIFFALSYYYNEMVMRNDHDWMKNAFFSKVLYKLKEEGIDTESGSLEKIFRNIIANVNFYDNEEAKEFLEETIKASFAGGKFDEEQVQTILQEQFGLLGDLSLVISALLSAATDNAKELILDKINAGPDFAGLYLHQIILGIDFLDIAAMMTSPTMYALKDLCQINAFNPLLHYNPNRRPLNMALELAEYGPKLQDFDANYDYSINRKLTNDQILQLKRYIYATKMVMWELNDPNVKKENESKEAFEKRLLDEVNKINKHNYINFLLDKKQHFFKVFVQAAKHANLLTEDKLHVTLLDPDYKQGNPARLVRPFKNLNGENILPTTEDLYQVNKFLYEYLRCAKIAANIDFNILNAISTMQQQANVTTTLGLAVLSSNQGFATDLVGKLKRLNSLERIMYEAESKFLTPDLRKLKDATLDPETREYHMKTFIRMARKLNPLLSSEEITAFVNKAIELNIFDEGFEFERFLNEDEYRQAAIKYYSCIKDSYNLYDVIDKLPHFNAIFQVYNIINTTDNYFSRKFKFIRSLTKRMYDMGYHGRYYTDKEYQGLSNLLDKYFAISWLDSLAVHMNLNTGEEFFDNSGNRFTVTQETPQIIDLSTDIGRAAYKLYMENSFIPALKNGIIKHYGSEQYKESLGTNEFIKDLVMSEDLDKTSGVKVPYIKLPIDMTHHDSKSDSIQFEKYAADVAKLASSDFIVKGISINNKEIVTVADMLFIYNLIVNADRYGSDRLTSIFGRHIRNNNSLALLYYRWQGELDYVCMDESKNIHDDDVLFSMAVMCPARLVDKQFSTFVIALPKPGSDSRPLVYRRNGKAKTTFNGEEVVLDEEENNEAYDIIEEGDLGGIISYIHYNKEAHMNDKTDDYYKYFTSRLPFESSYVSTLSINDTDLITANVDQLVDKIRKLMERNAIKAKLIC